jgi:hypothetical protein
VIPLTLATSSASAGFQTVTFVGELRVDYNDVASVEPDLDDDYFRDNTDKPALGGLISIRNTFTNVVGWYRLDGDPAGGATKTLALDDQWTYEIKLWSDAEVNGNNLIVQDDDDAPGHVTWYHVAETAWRPVPGTKLIETGSHDAWNILAAASHAMWRRSGGVSGETFYLYM